MDSDVDPLLALWCMVFLRGVDDYVYAVNTPEPPRRELRGNKRYKHDDQRWIRAAVRWLEDDRVEVGSFLWLCELFNRDPVRTREAIKIRAEQNLRVRLFIPAELGE